MQDENLADDPSYRAGIIMGRQQSITDVMELLLGSQAGNDSERLAAIMAWCIQTQDEAKTELTLVLAALEGSRE